MLSNVLRRRAQENHVEGGTGIDGIFGQSGDDWLHGDGGEHATARGSGSDDRSAGSVRGEL